MNAGFRLDAACRRVLFGPVLALGLAVALTACPKSTLASSNGTSASGTAGGGSGSSSSGTAGGPARFDISHFDRGEKLN